MGGGPDKGWADQRNNMKIISYIGAGRQDAMGFPLTIR
jgi:hypothetical protein